MNNFDVNAKDGVTAIDALLIINELAHQSVFDPDTHILLPVPPSGYAPPYYDVTQDGKLSALDALRVINEMARNQNAGTELEYPGPIEVRSERSFAFDSSTTGNDEPQSVDFDLVIFEANTPTIESILLYGGDAQRSAVTCETVTCERPVTIDSSQRSPFEFVNTHAGEAVQAIGLISNVAGRSVVDFNFPPVPSATPHSLLVNWNYQVLGIVVDIVRGELVMEGIGEGAGEDKSDLGAEAVDTFFRCFGDSDKDRDLAGQDYGRFGLKSLKTLLVLDTTP